MDHPETTTHVSLCAGYGGVDLGLRRVIQNLRTIALCEIEAYAVANLVAKMEAGLLDPAPIWPNLKTFPWATFRDRVDILSGGYPCQPFSAAGRRNGASDPRHLWPYIANGIAVSRPRLCFFENVEGHISLGLSDVIEDLAGMGYRTTWGIFSAAEVGAPHQRKRVFILAYRDGERGQLSHWWKLAAEQVPVGHGTTWRDVWPSCPGEQQHEWEPPRAVEDTYNSGDKWRTGRSIGNLTNEENREAQVSSRRCENRVSKFITIEPTLGRDTDGIADRVDYAELCVSCDNRADELRLLGNGVVPATAALAFSTLIQELNTETK